jgi:hypothetical protein
MVSLPMPLSEIASLQSHPRHELTGANGGEIEIRERSDLDRARRIAYILSQAAAAKAQD